MEGKGDDGRVIRMKVILNLKGLREALILDLHVMLLLVWP